jgi:hypothetical protein
VSREGYYGIGWQTINVSAQASNPVRHVDLPGSVVLSWRSRVLTTPVMITFGILLSIRFRLEALGGNAEED